MMRHFCKTLCLVGSVLLYCATITQAQITVKNVRLWTENNNTVPVCWETSGYDREKDIVQAAVTNTWQKFANINFTGWGACPARGGGIAGDPNAKQVRIRISPQDKDDKGNYIDAGAGGSARYGMDALSSAADNNPGVYMSFAPDGTADKGRVEYTAVHEFGHVLGFVHEQDSPSNATPHGMAHCANKSAGVEANATQLTDYDPDSVMNYCNKDGNMKGNLTEKDIAGLQKIYGQAPHDGYYKMICRGGPDFSNVLSDKVTLWNLNRMLIRVYFRRSATAPRGDYSKLDPGTCSWDDRTVNEDEPRVIHLYGSYAEREQLNAVLHSPNQLYEFYIRLTPVKNAERKDWYFLSGRHNRLPPLSEAK